jgi:hypothetical protein
LAGGASKWPTQEYDLVNGVPPMSLQARQGKGFDLGPCSENGGIAALCHQRRFDGRGRMCALVIDKSGPLAKLAAKR